MIFGLLKSVVPIAVLLALLAGMALYVKAQAAHIAQLETTTDLLKLSNDQMVADIKNVVAAQLLAGQAIERARLQAVQASHAVQTLNFSTASPSKLQLDINKSMADIFNDLQNTTRNK